MIYGKTRAVNLFLHQCGHQTTGWDTADVVANRPTRHGQCVALAGHHINAPQKGYAYHRDKKHQHKHAIRHDGHIMALMPKPVV